MTPDHSATSLASATPMLLTVAGIALVLALLACWWWGSRRASRKPRPPQKPHPRADSWDTPDHDEPGDSGGPHP
ncbi:DUF6479 family protein [Streptomyces halobius]|uniref:DUF6479 family protein n=1 Tax=Streptomyces halobius TaxID=2879846 RepID=A0ABY4M0C1_9ACTN|nr:DUF6479 family protein [Streptomyces halobius]UQA91194.1 DUF6479 family protein [Streptomyces halobius]